MVTALFQNASPHLTPFFVANQEGKRIQLLLREIVDSDESWKKGAKNAWVTDTSFPSVTVHLHRSGDASPFSDLWISR